MLVTAYQVDGMTCDHCVRAVTTELLMLPGVSSVQVDLGSGTATVTSADPLPVDAVREAIDEAGYHLVAD
ncbi:MAG: heavy-metal-associated domain-containing protein [Candidatus Nanopelagicales bacterium]